MASTRSWPSTCSSTRYLAGWPFSVATRPTTRPRKPLYSVCCLRPATTTSWPLLRPSRWSPEVEDLLFWLLRKLVRKGHPIIAPKIKNWVSMGPASSMESPTCLSAFPALSWSRPTHPLGPVSSSTACGSVGNSLRSWEGQLLLLARSLPAAMSCCSHCVRSRCDSSRSTTPLVKTVAFSVSPAIAATHTPLASASGGPCSLKSRLKASCQASPPFVPSCRNQKHSSSGPVCCLTSLQASRNRRRPLRAASSWPRPLAGTRNRATHEQDALHSPAHRSWKDCSVNSGKSLCELICSANRAEPSCTICGCCVAPCRVAGSMTK
mmetsp:Transcript_55333/g.161508  ORF Transcript_55333/g.161508 Transcript_55333/m.161508 type:complete len:322 (+) Transcript_55333:142-1107(+)